MKTIWHHFYKLVLRILHKYGWNWKNRVGGTQPRVEFSPLCSPLSISVLTELHPRWTQVTSSLCSGLRASHPASSRSLASLGFFIFMGWNTILKTLIYFLFNIWYVMTLTLWTLVLQAQSGNAVSQDFLNSYSTLNIFKCFFSHTNNHGTELRKKN